MTLTSSEESQALQLLHRFTTTIAVLQEIYDVTIYGQRHSEVRALQVLEKLGGKTRNSLTKKELQQAIEEVNAISRDSRVVVISLEKRDVETLRKVMRDSLHRIKKVPGLARIQMMVTLAANFEGYMADAIRMIFNNAPDALKSGKPTLKDEELVEALKSGDAMHVLIENRIRNIMYASATDWFSFLRKELGFRIQNSSDLAELFLVRNCVLHNSGNVSKELQATKKNRYRRLGRPINITKRDIDRYLAAASEGASAICEEYNRKFCPSTSSSSAVR